MTLSRRLMKLQPRLAGRLIVSGMDAANNARTLSQPEELSSLWAGLAVIVILAAIVVGSVIGIYVKITGTH